MPLLFYIPHAPDIGSVENQWVKDWILAMKFLSTTSFRSIRWETENYRLIEDSTPSPCGHSPYLIYDEQRERIESITLTVFTPSELYGDSPPPPIFYMAKRRRRRAGFSLYGLAFFLCKRAIPLDFLLSRYSHWLSTSLVIVRKPTSKVGRLYENTIFSGSFRKNKSAILMGNNSPFWETFLIK